ncbi:unnamed protein product [Ophioblennius macclurei]
MLPTITGGSAIKGENSNTCKATDLLKTRNLAVTPTQSLHFLPERLHIVVFYPRKSFRPEMNGFVLVGNKPATVYLLLRSADRSNAGSWIKECDDFVEELKPHKTWKFILMTACKAMVEEDAL